MLSAIAVFLGGGIGASLRYLFSLFAKKHFGLTHWATFIINILGCLFLGFIASLSINNPQLLETHLYLFLTTGIAGGFTTFSTFSSENIELLQKGNIFKSFSYISLSLTLGLFAVYCGFALAKLV